MDLRRAPLLALALLCACGDNIGGVPAQCNPLGGQGCLLPWPSAAYEVSDSSTVTGRRLAIPIEAMPTNIDDITIDPVWLNRFDGFSPTGPMLAAFDSGVSNEGLPSWMDPSPSLAADAPIVLVNADTGERAPYFAEVDQNTTDVLKRNLIIRPLARLATNAHYVVGIRKSVKAADGGDLSISSGFAAALAGSSVGHDRFDAKRYTQIFSALDSAGVPKTDLALAWDFHTASDDYLRRDLTTMRDAALPALGVNGANLTFAMKKTLPPRAGIYKRYLGTFTSPDFLTDGESDPSKLRRGSDGLPQMEGMRDANFAAIIPQCVDTQPLPRPTIIFGHGLFGSGEEYVSDDFVLDLAKQHCLVVIAGDFIGLTSRQLPLAPLAVNDLNRGPSIAEKIPQGVIDFIALETIARGPMQASAEFSFNGMPVIDPAQTFYVGGSLGGIMGNVFMAYDPNITKGVLAVPGGAWSLLFERSFAWHLLMGAAVGAYEDPEVYQLLIAFLGMGFEPYDPITTAAHVIKDPLPGIPVKEILMWYAIGDSLVTNISTEMIAREMGLQLLGPAVKEVWNLPPTAGPLQNAVTIYNEHPSPMPSDFNIPPAEDNGTHGGVNRRPAALRQVEQFLLHDQIIQTCGNGTPVPCDCATTACE
jgi:hypothetical protein